MANKKRPQATKFWRILKKTNAKPQQSLFDFQPEDWLTGYKRWKRTQPKD
jgi:hypothetical protein